MIQNPCDLEDTIAGVNCADLVPPLDADGHRLWNEEWNTRA